MQTRLLNNKTYVEFELADSIYLAPQIVGARYWDAYNKLVLNDFLNDPEFQAELKEVDPKKLSQEASNEVFTKLQQKYGVRYLDRVKVYMMAALLSYDTGARIDVVEADRLYDVASLQEVDAVVNFFNASGKPKKKDESTIVKSGKNSKAQKKVSR